MALIEERECTCEGCTCVINEKTIEEAMCRLGFDAVLQQLDLLGGLKPGWIWSFRTDLTPHKGVARLTVAPSRPKAWHYMRYGFDIRCGDTNVNERFVRALATTVCFEYMRLRDTEDHLPRRSSRLQQKNSEKCWEYMDKETGLLDPIQVHRQLGLLSGGKKQKMLYGLMGPTWRSGVSIWNLPRKGEREIPYQLFTPPDWSEHVRRQ